MNDRRTSKEPKSTPSEPRGSVSGPSERNGFGETLDSMLRRGDARGQAEDGDRAVRAPRFGPTTSERLEAFVEWLLSRCVGDGSEPPGSPAFLGEGERRLILETADSLGRELFGPERAAEGGRLVLRLVLDLCSGAPCKDRRSVPGVPPEECPGPDGGPRRAGEIGHLCVGGPLRLARCAPGPRPTALGAKGLRKSSPALQTTAKGKK